MTRHFCVENCPCRRCSSCGYTPPAIEIRNVGMDHFTKLGELLFGEVKK